VSVIHSEFTNKHITEAANAANCKSVGENTSYNVQVGVSNPTLLDGFAFVPFQGKANVSPAIHQTVVSILDTGVLVGHPFLPIGPYNLVQQAALENRVKQVSILKTAGYEKELKDPNVKAEDIETMSLLSCSATAALAFSLYWGVRGFDKTKLYRGNAPCTSPVKKFFQVIFSKNDPSQADVNYHTFMIAEEAGIDPYTVNTIMWLMGLKML
jgi:hypothetical protein